MVVVVVYEILTKDLNMIFHLLYHFKACDYLKQNSYIIILFTLLLSLFPINTNYYLIGLSISKKLKVEKNGIKLISHHFQYNPQHIDSEGWQVMMKEKAIH